MDITEILRLAVVGGAVSWILEYVTKKLDSNKAKLATIAMALIIGSGYAWLVDTQWLQTVIVVLTYSSTVYAFIIKK